MQEYITPLDNGLNIPSLDFFDAAYEQWMHLLFKSNIVQNSWLKCFAKKFDGWLIINFKISQNSSTNRQNLYTRSRKLPD